MARSGNLSQGPGEQGQSRTRQGAPPFGIGAAVFVQLTYMINIGIHCFFLTWQALFALRKQKFLELLVSEENRPELEQLVQVRGTLRAA